MGGRLLRVGQGVALGAVALLLGLLVWKVAFADDDTVAAALRDGETPAAPDLALQRLDDADRTLGLESLRGKAAVVNFWASWCIPCKDEAPILQKLWTDRRDDGLVVVGVDFNDLREDAQRFVERYGLTFPMVADRGKRAGEAFGITGLPETFVVDRRGRVIGHLIGGLDAERNAERLPGLVEQALASS